MPRPVCLTLVLKGCANRPFYHIIAGYPGRGDYQKTLEQIGSYDPMPNERNEKLVSINYDRLNYWVGQGAVLSRGTGMLLGMAGWSMVHPYSYRRAWRKRKEKMESTDPSASKDADHTSEAPAVSPNASN